MLHVKIDTFKNTAVEPLPIRIVAATTMPIDLFPTDTLLGKSLAVISPYPHLEYAIAATNIDPLGTIYNEAIEIAANYPAILVFAHDDVMICDFHWQQIIREGLKKFDIVGLAGCARRVKNQPMWAFHGMDLKTYDTDEFLSGMVGHGLGFPPDHVTSYGEIGQKCKLMDGILLAVDSRTLIKTGLQFDPQFAFHFYDLDFCRSAEMLNLSMGTIPLSVVHGSIENLHRVAWKASHDLYFKKWKD